MCRNAQVYCLCRRRVINLRWHGSFSEGANWLNCVRGRCPWMMQTESHRSNSFISNWPTFLPMTKTWSTKVLRSSRCDDDNVCFVVFYVCTIVKYSISISASLVLYVVALCSRSTTGPFAQHFEKAWPHKHTAGLQMKDFGLLPVTMSYCHFVATLQKCFV